MSHATPGIHHVTAIASDPQRNLDFYARVLGLRLVKLTVNFDDPGSYHFYFGDEAGTPGSILTFFPWPMARQGRRGVGQVVAISFAVSTDSLGFWKRRLSEMRVPNVRDEGQFDVPSLAFEDPDGMTIEIVGAPQESGSAWTVNGISRDHAIRGFFSVTIAVDGYQRTADLLTGTLGFAAIGNEGERFRFQAAGNGAASIVDVLCTPDSWNGSMGAGVVHHVAFRATDAPSHESLRLELIKQGFNVTPIVDRNYFRSVYFREPGGTLFEIATDAPGFAVDEPLESLGSSLKLPAQFERKREFLEARLPRISLPSGQSRGGVK